MSTQNNKGALVALESAIELLATGNYYTCAADESTLQKLPIGNWIGGTIPYFMGEAGGETTKDKVFMQELPAFWSGLSSQPIIKEYSKETLPSIVEDAPENGFTILLLPSGSDIHREFSQNGPNYEMMYMKPLIGWVTGVHLDDLAKKKPMVFNGLTSNASNDKAIAVHCQLPEGKYANIDIINLFEQGKGDVFTFKQEGFDIQECFINGEPSNFSEYIVEKRIDTRLPLVADYCGVMINVALQAVDQEKASVALYAPVFAGVEYRFAEDVGSYASHFEKSMSAKTSQVSFACNCILNYLYCELEGKQSGSLLGPMTFGEIAYQLLNQTLVYMRIEEL